MLADFFTYDHRTTVEVTRKPQTTPWKTTLRFTEGNTAVTIYLTPDSEAKLIAMLTLPAPSADTLADESEVVPADAA